MKRFQSYLHCSCPQAFLQLLMLATGILCVTTTLWGSSRRSNEEWPTYAADLKGSRYRPVDQINASNFSKLEIAWTFKTGNLGTCPEYRLEGTPLMVNGVLYATSGTRRTVVALDAATGELLWVHAEHEGQRGAAAPRQLSGRGLAHWTDGKYGRVLYFTPGYRLVALNAKTGAPVATFGKDGLVDLKEGVVYGTGRPIDLVTGEIVRQSTPIVAKDIVIVGSSMREGRTPKTRNNTKGLVRAYDVRTGKRLWTFWTIPQPGEFCNDTWENNSSAVDGNTGVWTQITVDEDLGLVYLPVESPTGDCDGGHRPGADLFGETLVCVDPKTGRRKWFYQFVHHAVWNMDIFSAPILADITVDGRAITVAVPTKQAWLYVLDRVTGKPVWPMEERPVQLSDVPGEKTSPTQPFSTKPPVYDRQGVSIDDLIEITPELRQRAIKLISRNRIGPIFTPPVVSKIGLGIAAPHYLSEGVHVQLEVRTRQNATLSSDETSRSIWDGVYTEEQAGRGHASYHQHCESCHGEALLGNDEAPALVGAQFLGNWSGLTVGDLFERIRLSMPQNNPGHLSRQTNADILSYIFQVNSFPPGKMELARETEVLKQIRIESAKPDKGNHVSESPR